MATRGWDGDGDPLFGGSADPLRGDPRRLDGGFTPPRGTNWDEPSGLVRPYAVTGGRTEPRYRLPLEALVTSAPTLHHDMASLTPEYQAITAMCREPRSVAEVSALLRLPLGVARVLIADMAAEGLLHIHQPVLDDGRPDLNLLERVLSGLRKL